MLVRLGYACISKTLDSVTTSSNYTYTAFEQEKDYEKLDRIISSNLYDLEKIIDYNIKNNIHFYRMSSKLIPLATHEKVNFDYVTKYKQEMKRIGQKIKMYGMRIDFHPDQFCVLNSTRKEVVENSIRILEYLENLLEMLEVEDKVLILHIGSLEFGKKQAIARFAHRFIELPENIRASIVIENDDKTYNILDCLELNKKIGIPIVLDYHHYMCNSGKIELSDYIEQIFKTWKEKRPKVHFSSPKNKTKKEMRSHNDYIDSDEFIKFIEIMKRVDKDFDVMIEAKAKDEALFRLIRELKYKTSYKFVDDTTFLV